MTAQVLRSLDRGQAAVDALSEALPDADFELQELDLASLDSIRSGHQPVDLRRTPGIPIIGGKLAWVLPIPNSLKLLERYREKATAKDLIFLVDAADREQGEQVARAICFSLGVRNQIHAITRPQCIWIQSF